MEKYLAHVNKEISESPEHDLVDHLMDVAHLAKQFADEFDSGEWAYAAGLWHDLGKFGQDFQNYIVSKSGYDPDAHIEEGKRRVDHSAAGAIYAINKFRFGRVLAYLIAGHHTGLPDWDVTQEPGSTLSERIEKKELLSHALKEDIPSDILNLPEPQVRFSISPDSISLSLWIRMLFSCLVDADFLDTEKFMDINRHKMRQDYPSLSTLKENFDAFMEVKISQAKQTEINQCRQEILNQCKEKASLKPGIFSLTVPTGGGKTLSSMVFALEHALKYGKKRIIYVIPYTSIIEQTADVYREAFGEFKDAIIEHHSNLDSEKENMQSRLACENWDAPIIITTNVQFFESLFAARTSRTRKLHNIVNSVVIFDEAQQLPPDFLNPILSTLEELSDKYRVSCVLATATQPALSGKPGNFYTEFKGLKKVTEIIDNVEEIYSRLKRVEVKFPDNIDTPQNWEILAQELIAHPQVLCIVNTRKDCRELFDYMPQGTIHLSALMCGEHRSLVIKEIKQKLANGENIRVISTQLVEAGVDIDFPHVYRALAGMDSIAQAAGRCNREGRLPDKGQVVVFTPPKRSPPGLLRKGEDITRSLIKGCIADPLAPQIFHHYFGQLYWHAGGLDKHKIENLLSQNAAKLCIQFRTVASLFKMIDDDMSLPVVVLYKDSAALIEELISLGASRARSRKLQRYTVAIPKGAHEKLLSNGLIQKIGNTGIYAQKSSGLYHPIKGFLDDLELFDPLDCII